MRKNFSRWRGNIRISSAMKCDSGSRRVARIYREPRFVLLSSMESLSLSALEAAACECPLLLSDLPWARSTFGDAASLLSVGSPEHAAKNLRTFYDAAPSLAPRPGRHRGKTSPAS